MADRSQVEKNPGDTVEGSQKNRGLEGHQREKKQSRSKLKNINSRAGVRAALELPVRNIPVGKRTGSMMGQTLFGLRGGASEGGRSTPGGCFGFVKAPTATTPTETSYHLRTEVIEGEKSCMKLGTNGY